MDKTRAKRILENAEEIKRTKDAGHFSALVDEYNEFIKIEKLHYPRITYNEDNDTVYMSGELHANGTKKLNQIVFNVSQITKSIGAKPVLEKQGSSFLIKIFRWIFGVGLSGAIIFGFGYMYNQGAQSTLRKYDTEKFDLKLKIDSMERIIKKYEIERNDLFKQHKEIADSTN